MTARRIWIRWHTWIGMVLHWDSPSTARFLRRTIYRRNHEWGLS